MNDKQIKEQLKKDFLKYAKTILPTKPKLKNLRVHMVAGFLDYATIIASCDYTINGIKKNDANLIKYDGDFSYNYIQGGNMSDKQTEQHIKLAIAFANNSFDKAALYSMLKGNIPYDINYCNKFYIER